MVWRPLHSCEKDAPKKTISNKLGHMTGARNSTRAHGLETLHICEKVCGKEDYIYIFNLHMCANHHHVYVARDI